MICTLNDVNLSFDKEDRLRKTIMRVGGTNTNKVIVLASFLTNADFKKFLLENITEDDVLQGETISFNLFTNNDYVKLKQNKLGSLLSDFYKNTYLSVDNTTTVRGLGRLDGFSSASAKKTAKDYTASLLIDEYTKEFGNKRKKPLEIIAAVNDKIIKTFYQRLDDFNKYLLSKDDTPERAKEMIRQYNEYVVKINEINSANKRDSNLINSNNLRQEEFTKQDKDYRRQRRKAKADNNANEINRLTKAIEELIKERTEISNEAKRASQAQLDRNKTGAFLSRQKYALAQNIVALFGDNYADKQSVKLRNYANLVNQVRANADAWYFQVFNTKYMTSIVKEFNKIGDIEEYLENQDDNNDILNSKYNENNIDETTKSWEDSLYNHFNQAVSGRLKMILSSVPKLINKYNPTDKVQALDTENELGVSTYMDAQYLTVQIFSFGDFSSVESLIKSLDVKTQSIKSIYGLGMIVNMMKQYKDFANLVWANFAKPICNKTMLTISDISNANGIRFNYSNPTAFPLVELVFRMSNKLKATYNTNYNINDKATLKKISDDYKKYKNKQTLYNDLFKVITKYFPNINKDIFDNYFNNIPDTEFKSSINILIGHLNGLINGIGNLKTSINNRTYELDNKYREARNEYKKKLAEYNNLPNSVKKNATKPVPPVHKYVNYADYDLNKQIYSGIIGFATQIVGYVDSHAQLNSTNAEGNTESNVLKNCYVTRFFDQIMAGNETDANAGLQSLLDYVTQGTKDGSDNQYSNNPLFWGLKDENGIVIQDGLFKKTATGYEVNKNAKDILKYNLFSGSKNTQDSKAAGYAAMSKIDFFITQFMAFRDSVAEMTENGKSTKVNNFDTAVYPMRIGSDAPKIFFIRAPKYDRDNVKLAIYNHLMDEFNLFITGINQMFAPEAYTVEEGVTDVIYKTRTDVNGLIGRAFFDEKTADKLKQDGKTDMTAAIIKDGKLRGNIFKFLRLFDVNGYSASKKIEDVISLYGGVNKVGLMNLDPDGRLRLNLGGIIVHNEQTGKLELNLNTNIKEALKTIVNEWTANFLLEANGRTAGFKQVLVDNNIPFDNYMLENFLLNTVNMNMNYDDLFEGDYKYYSGARDFLKRTKESQAGGDSYAGYDVTAPFDPTINELEWNGKPETIEIESKALDKDGNPIREPIVINGKKLIAKNGFRGVTIYNTIKGSDYVNDMQKYLEEEFIKSGMSEENAHKRSVKIASGYGFAGGDRTKVNDAQSYITLEEFIRRRWADGTIGEYADLIRQLTDDTPIEELDLDEINARIQVQKNFYYDKVFDETTGVFYPRQIKNAEFVIIPKLFPKDSELRKIHDWMEANNIGQLNTAETSKAAKKNVFTIWGVSDGKFDENFASKFDESYVEDYFYQYLYKQQDVPQHMMDEHNKAGIQIMKKIIDNIINEEELNLPDNEDGTEHPLKTRRKRLMKLADEYQDAYTANIKEDFERFLDGMGWTYENGKIVNAKYATTDVYGNKLPDSVIETNKTTLNFTNFYSRAREEAARLGMDSNFMEYLIPNEFGNPRMPNYMNIVATKLESVAQSIYNNKITRQVLPGWHAAQITGVGYSKRLKFDPKTGVMEVYLPRWSRLIPKTKNAKEEAELIKQIETEGLDIHIGYRIPTEGKQSISILKVVGFTNDALGSTIVVPDEWVTQTGSDFDVDSVYGISWEIYATKDKNGRTVLHKVPYEEIDVDEQALYVRYVNNRLEDKIKRTDIGNEIESSIQEIRDRLNFVNERGEYNKEFQVIDAKRNELFNSLPNWARGMSKDIDIKAKRVARKNKTVVDIRETYPDIKAALSSYLERRNVPEADAVVKEYIDYLTALIDVMNRQDGLPSFDKAEYFSEKNNAIIDLVQQAKNAQLKACNDAAKENGLLTYEEWSKQPFVNKLDRRSRNNYIISRMIDIMADDTSREEQYGRSHFEGITNGKGTGANDIINRISGESSRPRSPYNPLDQLDFFEDALGGARLKALSVNWDTFVSKNNRIRAVLDEINSIDVVLTVGEKSAEDSEITYNEAGIKESYGDDIQEYSPVEGNNDTSSTSNELVGETEDAISKPSGKRKVLFKARRIGWSNNNRNLTGNLITTYTFQTTAYHLNAVKMGSVPNVDEYTFSTYKLLSSLGIDFETVIGFIRQPVITNLVANNNLINSVFVSSNDNPINMTLIDIAKGLGLKDGKYEFTHNSYVFNAITALKNHREFVLSLNNILGVDISNMSEIDILNLKVPLDKEMLFARIKRNAQNKGNPIENAAFDFAMLLTFRNIQKTANKINDYISATAADKFGARQSIYETRNIIDLINKLRSDTTLTKNGVNFIEFMYPSDPGSSVINVEDSRYKSIAAVYNYATNTSLQTNSKLFVTENEDFNDTELIIRGILHHRFTETEHKEYKRYAISYLYNQISKLLTPITVDKRGMIIPNTERIDEINAELKTANEYWNAERSRICGYGVATDGDFDIENVNKPTKVEINKFLKLTPAQKVLFMQKHFPDNQGIFAHIKVTLLNNTDAKYRGVSRQYLAFDDQVDSIEDLLYLFSQSFSNRNPLIKLAAIDLIKYAFIAEGFNFRTGYISKIVPNETLYTDAERGGMDIIDEIKSRINSLAYEMRSEEFINNYVRSHSNIIPITRLKALPKKKFDYNVLDFVYEYYNQSTQFLSSMRSDNLVHIDATMDNKLVDGLVKKMKLFKNANGFVKVAFPVNEEHTATVLFKVDARNPVIDAHGDVIAYQDYFLIPLNLLDRYENYDYSYNKNYNIFNSYEYYKSTVQELATKMYEARFSTEYSYRLETEDNNLNDNERASIERKYNKERNAIRGKVNRTVTGKRNPIGAYNNMKFNL